MPTETKSDMLYEQRKVRNFLYNIQLFTLLATGGFAIVGAWSGSLVEPSGKWKREIESTHNFCHILKKKKEKEKKKKKEQKEKQNREHTVKRGILSPNPIN
jgi:hypothetical protein